MSNQTKDPLGQLLAEWNQVPCPVFGTAEKVIQACRPAERRSAPAGFRLVFACLVFGTMTGAVYAELFSLRNEDLFNSQMSNRYLQSIDPGISSAASQFEAG